MPILSRRQRQDVDFWRVYGHSWFQFQNGPSGDQTGRVDAMFRSAMDVEYASWRNYAFAGARVAGQTKGLGGWTRVMQNVTPPLNRLYPYAPDGGGTVLCYGINDLSYYGGQLANVKSSTINAIRACISKVRSSRTYLATDAVFTYGAGFTATALGTDASQGSAGRQCTTTTSATITMTLPADYHGEVVAFAFLQQPDVTGGTVTFSGTASQTGTLYVGNGLPSAFVTHGYMVRRFTGLTAANAGQTIIATTTAMDASGTIFFDGGWLESLTPPPCLVLNVSRPTTAGYALLAIFGSWTGTEAAKDADVVAYNATLQTMLLEFDGMVQYADCDVLVGKDTTAFSDGVHPNEYGAGKIVDALLGARDNLRPPVTATSQSMGFNPPSPRVGLRRKPRLVNNWYTCDYQVAAATSYTPVVGHMWAMPFEITESRDLWSQFSTEVVAAGSVGATIRWGIYDDVGFSGYPQDLIPGMDVTVAGAFTLTTSTGVKTSASFTTNFVPDPGLYWLVMKIDTTGTAQTIRALQGFNDCMPNLTTTGLALSSAAGYLGWLATGVATGVLPSSYPAGGTVQTSVPLLGMLKTK